MGLPSLGIALTTIVLFMLIGIGITAGYHRYYSHRSYKTNKIIESILLFFGTLAAENSVLLWSFDHRLHHRYVDTDKDPYSIKKGFLYAHILWIFEKSRYFDKKVVPDLLNNKLVMFQHKYYVHLLTFINIFLVAVIGFVFNDLFGALVFCLLLRMFLVHHFTFTINSLAHMWGSKPYSKEQSAVDNHLISLVSFGEGYHNYHHAFPSDYRNGRGWHHYDPTKWFVWLGSKTGLTWGLISFHPYIIKNKLLLEDKRLMLDKIKFMMHEKKEEVKKRVYQLSEQLSEQLISLHAMKKSYIRKKKMRVHKEKLIQLRKEMKIRIKAMKADWRMWSILVKGVLRVKPQVV